MRKPTLPSEERREIIYVHLYLVMGRKILRNWYPVLYANSHDRRPDLSLRTEPSCGNIGISTLNSGSHVHMLQLKEFLKYSSTPVSSAFEASNVRTLASFAERADGGRLQHLMAVSLPSLSIQEVREGCRQQLPAIRCPFTLCR